MAKIEIKKDRCKGCLLCLINCPKGLIIKDKNLNVRGVEAVVFNDSGECSGCTFCAIVCPEVCIEVYK